MVPRIRLALVALAAVQASFSAGCSHSSPVNAATLPICLRAEAADHASGIVEFTFDPDGDLTLSVEFDNTGKELARTTLTWSPSAIVVARTGGAFPFEQRGTFGPHGELVDFAGDGDHAHFTWSGTFAPVTSPAASRFAFERFYHVEGEEPLLPLDTAARSFWPRMHPFLFTGTVTIHRDSKPISADVRATYDGGHQTLLVGGGLHPYSLVTTWSGDEPISQDLSQHDAHTHRTFTFAHGHLTRLAGGPDVTFTYSGGGILQHVHVAPALDVEIARCAR